MIVREATMDDFIQIYNFIDNTFTKEGYGFVNREQIKTEILKKRVVVAIDGELVGLRIGLKRLWNLIVHPHRRGEGIGRLLVDYYRPNIIRVKSNPVGHLSKQQKMDFIDPTEFYEKLGFIKCGEDYGRNFWAGQRGDKRIAISKGEKKHIKGYRNPETTLL